MKSFGKKRCNNETKQSNHDKKKRKGEKERENHEKFVFVHINYISSESIYHRNSYSYKVKSNSFILFSTKDNNVNLFVN